MFACVLLYIIASRKGMHEVKFYVRNPLLLFCVNSTRGGNQKFGKGKECLCWETVDLAALETCKAGCI